MPSAAARSIVSAVMPLSIRADTIFTVSTSPNVNRPCSGATSRVFAIHRTRSSGHPASAATSAAE
jgi:hypothetical protein